MRNLLLLIMCFIITSCKANNADSLQAQFVNKVWFVSHEETGDASAPNMLKRNLVIIPQEDGTMAPYREQQNFYYTNYYIKNNTIYISAPFINNSIPVPYRYKKINEYSSQLISLDASSYQIIHLTDLTDLFDGTVDNTKSALYNKIKQYCWYPTRISYIDDNREEVDVYSKQYPKWHLKEMAFYIKGDRVSFLYANPGDKYKFTDNTIYIVDKDNTLYENHIFKVSFLWGMEFEALNSYRSLMITFKKIDPYILVDESQLSKKDRFGCDESQVRNKLKMMIEMNNGKNNNVFYDVKSIKLTQKDEENCEYIYSYTGFFNLNGQKIPHTRKIRVFYKEDGTDDIEILE